MYFGLTEDQRDLRDSLTQVLERACGPDVVAAAWSDGGPAARRVTAVLADVGTLGLVVPSSAGGMELTDADTWALWAALGYAAVPAPVVETAAVVAPLLAAAGLEYADRLAAVLAGTTLATAAAVPDLVPFAGAADLVLLIDGPDARLAPAAGLEPVAAVDGARTLARPGEGYAPLPVDAAAVSAAVDRMRLATAGQLVGLGRRMLDITVTYVSGREQFGQPVGAFQAVKHALATAAVRLAEAEAGVAHAAWSMAPVDLARAGVLARETAETVALTSIQCHGAMGYTTEYLLHLYVKRAWALASSWGTADAELDRVVEALGIGG